MCETSIWRWQYGTVTTRRLAEPEPRSLLLGPTESVSDPRQHVHVILLPQVPARIRCRTQLVDPVHARSNGRMEWIPRTLVPTSPCPHTSHTAPGPTTVNPGGNGQTPAHLAGTQLRPAHTHVADTWVPPRSAPRVFADLSRARGRHRLGLIIIV